jgi:hypothetical protein
VDEEGQESLLGAVKRCPWSPKDVSLSMFFIINSIVGVKSFGGKFETDDGETLQCPFVQNPKGFIIHRTGGFAIAVERMAR